MTTLHKLMRLGHDEDDDVDNLPDEKYLINMETQLPSRQH